MSLRLDRARTALARAVVLVGLAAVACQPAAAPPAATPAAAQPAPTSAAPAQAAAPTQAAAAPTQPAAAPTQAAKPKLADFKIAVSGEGEWKNNKQVATNFNKTPAGIALESLVADGVKVEPSYLNESEAPMQALVQGSVQMAQTAFSSAIAGIQKGAPAKIIAETRRAEYVMVALKDMSTPKDFNGKRVAIHSNVSSVAMLTQLFLKDSPDVKPNILVIPGSPNRIQAMLSGQIDASVVQLGDDDGIMQQQPDKWHVVYNYPKEMPDLLDAVLVVRDDFLAQNRPTVVEFTKRILETHRKVNSDQAYLVQAAKDREVTIPKGATLENHARRYVESRVFPDDGGLNPQALKFSITAAKDTGFIASEVPLDKAADLNVLQEALKAVGTR